MAVFAWYPCHVKIAVMLLDFIMIGSEWNIYELLNENIPLVVFLGQAMIMQIGLKSSIFNLYLNFLESDELIIKNVQ